MKAEIIFPGSAPKQFDFISAPHVGDLVFVDGRRVNVKQITHDMTRRQLIVSCEDANPFEAFCHSQPVEVAEIDTDIDENDE